MKYFSKFDLKCKKTYQADEKNYYDYELNVLSYKDDLKIDKRIIFQYYIFLM